MKKTSLIKPTIDDGTDDLMNLAEFRSISASVTSSKTAQRPVQGGRKLSPG